VRQSSDCGEILTSEPIIRMAQDRDSVKATASTDAYMLSQYLQYR
jgi:hypothetical protein